MLHIEHLSKTYGTTPVLADVSFIVGAGQKVALVGYNGTGKSTILKIVAGQVQADGGSVRVSPGTRIGYLSQEVIVEGASSVRDYLREKTGIAELERVMQASEGTLDNSDSRRRYDDALSLYERMEGYTFDYRAETLLAGFGLETVSLDRSVAELSGGQKTKIGITALLLQENDILLLDEPTNNLDLPALIWLEDYLRRLKVTLLFVSHDRRFIDRIAEKVVEIDWRERTATMMAGTYSDYLAEMARRKESQRQAYEKQQEEIQRLTERSTAIRAKAEGGAKMVDDDKFRQGFMRDKASKSAKGAKVIEKRIEQMDKVEKPFDRDPLYIEVGSDVGAGNRDIEISGLVAGYDSFTIGPIDLRLEFGSRVGILGLNGSGKSTLLRAIEGGVARRSGSVAVGKNVRIGNMMQEHETLDRELSPLQHLVEKVGVDLTEAHWLLARFGVSQDSVKRTMRELSPGGRARMLIAQFSAERKNVLLLDEPTNHLDLEAIEALEEALATFGGTLVVVSHDRTFIERAKLDVIYEMIDGRLRRLEDYTAYIARSEDRARRLSRLV